MTQNTDPPPTGAADAPEGVTHKQRRSRSRHAGSLGDYQTRKGRRWKFQIYVLIDPEKPELGEKRLTRGGFTDLEEAQAALTEAIRKRARNEKFQGKTPTVGVYAEHWVSSLRLAASTIKGYRKIIRNHITPDLGRIRIDKLTATRIGSHYRELEKHGRKDEHGKGKPLSANSIHKVHVVLGAMLDAAIDDGLLSVNPSKKRRTVNAPKSSQVRAEKPEIVTWTGEQLGIFLTWNRDELKDELFPLWRLIA